ncbi:MAG: OmpA family protein [Myxococcota bacterium]
MRTLTLLFTIALLAACGGSSTEADRTTVQAPPAEPAPEPVAEAPPAPDPEDVRIVDDHLEVDGVIHFATDSDEILDDSFTLLDHVALLIANHTGEIGHLKIVGHTDAEGSDAYNQELSERRAASVARYLEGQGVTIELEHSGVGESEPVCSEDTDECHERNRRVEFLIINE